MNLPFAPYEGPEPYIFVSYAHANKEKVYPIIKRLDEMGYRLWYDEGIEAGDEWPAVIQAHLRKATCMLLFLSPEAIASKWVKKEINMAIKRDIHIAGAFLMKTELPDALDYQLTDVQLLFYEYYKDDVAFLQKLLKGLPKEVKRPEPSTASSESDFDWELTSDTTIAIAEQYEAEGNPAMYKRLSKMAVRMGIDVTTLLDKGDALYSSGDEEGAKGAYAQAILALKHRHIPRLKKSIRNYLDLCEKEANIVPIIALYHMAKDLEFEDVELFYMIGTFFARTRQSDALVNECFDVVDALIDRDG